MATTSSLQLIIDLVNNTEAKFKEISNNFDAMQKQTENTRAALQKVAVVSGLAFAAVSGVIYSTVKASAEADAQIAKVDATLRAMEGTTRTVVTSTQKVAGAFKVSGIEAIKLQQSISAATLNIDQLNAQQKKLDEQLKKGKISNSDYALATRGISQNITEAKTAIEDYTQKLGATDTKTISHTKSVKVMAEGFDVVRKKIMDAAAAVTQMGFDDEAAAVSMATFYQRTNDVAESQKLLTLAMDLSRAKGLDLETSTKMITMALSGAGKIFKQYGIDIDDTTKPMDALAILQKKVGGQAIAFSETLAGKQEILARSVENLQESIGSALTPAIVKLLSAITPVIQKVMAWVEAHPKLTAIILISLAAVTGLVFALSTLGLAMMALVPIAAGLGISMLALFGWMLLIPAAIAAIIAIGYLLVTHWEQVKAFAMNVWNSIIDTVSDAMLAVWSAIQSTMSNISIFLSSTWTTIQNIFWVAIDFIIGLWMYMMDFMFPGWQEMLTNIWNVTVLILGQVQSFISIAFNTIAAIVSSVVKTIQGVWTGAWNAVRDAFVTVWNVIKSVADASFKFISDGINSLLGPLQKMIDLANAAYSAATKVASVVGGVVSGSVGAVVSRGASITGRATGGPVNPMSPYIVGENGPELFSPATYGRISPAGAGGASITLIIQGNSFMGQEGVAEMIGKQIMDSLKKNIKL